MEDYFKGITTKEGARRRFVALAKKLHPDVSERISHEAMLALCQQYKETLTRFTIVQLKKPTVEPADKAGIKGPPSIDREIVRDGTNEGCRSSKQARDRELLEIIEDGVLLAERVGGLLLKSAIISIRQKLTR